MIGLKETGPVLSAVVSLADNYDVWSVRYQNRELWNSYLINDQIVQGLQQSDCSDSREHRGVRII